MINQRQILGYIASATLALGTLLPLVSVPIVGTLNYLSSIPESLGGTGIADGIFILAFAALGAVLVALNKFKLLLIPAIGALALTAFTFIGLAVKINDMKSQLESSLAGNPFAGLATGLLSTLRLEWGWVVLFAGGALLLLVALGVLPRAPKTQTAEGAEEPSEE
jgi:hypothetical protein